MIRLLLLLSTISCVTSSNPDKNLKNEYKENAICKNTLQHDIHRTQCMR